ncbi:MAG: MerR family DNA-binding transcriptional regulator [Alphaproteobacteria bacterium]|nr:MerR family DNA-binding transcriptional regulator [Alphaproteobacteria bacterium]
MLTVRQLARRFGLSRATLLYYDRIGLLHPTARSPAGYRLYDADAEARLADIALYRNAGLSLQAMAVVLDGPRTEEAGILTARMRALDTEIGRLRAQQRAIAELIAQGSDGAKTREFDKNAWVGVLEAAGMDEAQMLRWHKAFEANAPQAHQAFLTWLGISEVEIAALRQHVGGAAD